MNRLFYPSRAGSLMLNAMGVASNQDVSALAHPVRPTQTRMQEDAAQRCFLFEGALARVRSWSSHSPFGARRMREPDPHPSA